MFGLRYLPGVATLTLDAERCDCCGMCVTVCPHAVFGLGNRRAQIVDRDACMECGACAKNCPNEAISVRSGVGCATAVIIRAVRGTGTDCGCSCETPRCK